MKRNFLLILLNTKASYCLQFCIGMYILNLLNLKSTLLLQFILQNNYCSKITKKAFSKRFSRGILKKVLKPKNGNNCKKNQIKSN